MSTPTQFQPLRDVPQSLFKKGDVLVVFGEVFARGYVNGLIEDAKAHGLQVVYSTVGRRESGVLRKLNSEELNEKKNMGQWPLVNIPLECGFDLEPASNGVTPAAQLKDLKLSEWANAKLDWDLVDESRAGGAKHFQERVREYMKELHALIPDGANVLFAHTMAGGVPRAKIVLPAMNRVFKGFGERFASSREFWEGEMGKLCSANFMDVTANSFAGLIEGSEELRQKIESRSGKVAYVAFGYHGNEILIGGKYRWQSYSPYLQGFAKLELERHATHFAKSGLKTTVFNVPEILTDSSAIFPGVEVPLYPLMAALEKECAQAETTQFIKNRASELLNPDVTIEKILDVTDAYFLSELKQNWSNFAAWPQHNSAEQMEQMQAVSERIFGFHKDPRQLLTKDLSEVVFRSCGRAMLREGIQPRESVWWVGHDLVARLAE